MNHPLSLDGGSVFLVGHGYAPLVTVRDGEGNVAYKGPAVFLPQDSSFASFGVIKVPDALPEQLGFEGLFLPTYGFSMETGPYSRFPDALDPVMSLLPYRGDLGLDTGEPQSVYELDKDQLEVMKKPDGKDFRLDLAVGQTKQLPDGSGSITFDGVDRWVSSRSATSPARARARWRAPRDHRPARVTVHPAPPRLGAGASEGGRTLVELAGLDRSSGGDLGTSSTSSSAPCHDKPQPRRRSRDPRGLCLVQQQRHRLRLGRLRPGLGQPHRRVGVRAVGPGRDLRGRAAGGGRGRGGRRTVVRRPAAAGTGTVAAEPSGDLASKVENLEKFGRIGVALTVVAALLHLAGLVTRGLGADPARVPWGNMYEFSVAGAFGVTLIYLVLCGSTPCAGWASSSPASPWSC